MQRSPETNTTSSDPFTQGLVLREARKLKKATQCFQHATVLHPDFADAWFYLGVTLDNRGQEAEAIPCYRRAISLGLAEQEHFEAHIYLASSLQKTKQPQEADLCLRIAEETGKEDELLAKIRRRITRDLNRLTFKNSRQTV